MDWFERLYNGIVTAFTHAHTHEGPCRVVVHNDAQRHLGKSAVEQLAREKGKESDAVILVEENEKPVGFLLCKSQ